MNLEIIKNRCRVDDDGHWIWQGALSNGKWPRIFAPNLAKPGWPMETQTGRRAVWQMHTGMAIPDGWRVYGTCEYDQCLNPNCMKCGPASDWGQQLRVTQKYKGRANRQAASRSVGRRRSVLTEESYMEVLTSNESGRALARRLQVSEQTVSKARNGELVCFQPVGGLFSGLLAANHNNRKRA